eukprot:4102528-Alexandrium_andersonii.AAC.1
MPHAEMSAEATTCQALHEPRNSQNRALQPSFPGATPAHTPLCTLPQEESASPRGRPARRQSTSRQLECSTQTSMRPEGTH